MEKDCNTCEYFGPDEDPICNWFACDGLECDECNYVPKGERAETLTSWEIKTDFGGMIVKYICPRCKKEAHVSMFTEHILNPPICPFCKEWINEDAKNGYYWVH